MNVNIANSKTWAWTRRWIPQGETDSSWQADDRSSTLEQLRDERVLVLVGDPGSGKSTELNKEREIVESILGSSRVMNIDSKKGISTDFALTRIWFDSNSWKNWLDSNDILYVFLDGLDELSHRIPEIAEVILQILESDLRSNRDARQRLRLRICSRRIGLPSDFEERLSRIFYMSEEPTTESDSESEWKTEGIAHLLEPHGPLVYSLAPLSNSEVGLAAESMGIDIDAFHSELERRGFGTLAKRPRTLKFLLLEFMQHGAVEGSYEDIYWRGLCQLVANESRVSDPDRILKRLARIAFVMAFSKTSYLQLGTTTPPFDPGIPLGVNVFLEPTNSITSDFIPFTVEQLDSLPRLNLYTGGSESFTWAELPDMEFLAAKYSVDCGLPPGQILELLRNPRDSKGKVVPELSNVAAQLAGMQEEVFAEILKHDPGLLIRADSALVDDEARQSVLEALLDAFESGDLVKTQWYNRDHFALLKFDGIVDALRPYISNTDLKTVTRDIAIDIASDCQVTGVVDDLAAIVRSIDEEEVLRRSAAWTLYYLGTSEAINHLTNLLIEPPVSDDLQELQGVALRALWPNKWSLEKILPHITHPKSEVLGAYRLFLGQDFIQGLRVEDLPTMYEWVDRQTGWNDELRALDQLTEALIKKAVDTLPEESAVQFITSRIVEPGELGLFRKPYLGESILLMPAAESMESRRALVEQLVKLESSEGEIYGRAFDGAYNLYSILPVEAQRADIQWIADQAIAIDITSEERAAWFRLFRVFGDGSDSYWMNLAYRLYRDSQFNQYLAPSFDAIALNSEQAKIQKRNWEIFHQKQDDIDEANDTEWFRIEFNQINEKHLSDPGDKWFCFDQLLRRIPPNRVSDGGHIDVCEGLENWHLVSQEMLDSFVSAAKMALLSFTPMVKSVGTKTFYLNDLAAYRAMTLLLRHTDEKLSFLRQCDWQRLGPVVIAMQPSSSESPPEYFSELLEAAIDSGFNWKPWLYQMIEVSDGSDFYYRHFLRVLTEILPDEEFRDLFEVLVSPKAPRSTVHQVASILGIRLPELVTDKLIALLREHDLDVETRENLVGTALDYVSVDQWRDMEALFENDTSLFETAFLNYAQWDRDAEGLVSRISEYEVANLYKKLAHSFPPAEDINPIGVHMVTPRERVGRWREDILSHLVLRGTWEAVDALRVLAAELPEIDWLPLRVAQAEAQARQDTWQPHRVEDLLKFVPSSGARIVRSNEQLQAVLVESLQRLSAELQGESPSVHDLWTSRSSSKSEPKYEDDLSDYIKRFLDRDLTTIPVFSNREVNNRPGERNDIYVQCAGADDSNALKVVVEVKGCWNVEVLTNMSSQLANQYMVTTQTRFGLYVVGFFDCEAWPAKNKRPHAAAEHTIEGLREELERQAQEIAKTGMIVVPVIMDCRLP